MDSTCYISRGNPDSGAVVASNLGIAEDHFSQPQGSDYTSAEDLAIAIEECKQKVLASPAHSETRWQMVQTLVDLRMRQAEAKVQRFACS